MKVCVVMGSACGGGGGLGQLLSHGMLHYLLQFDGYVNDSFFHFVKTFKLLSYFSMCIVHRPSKMHKGGG